MKPKVALEDIKHFIDNLRLTSEAAKPNDEFSRALYRKFHAVLIWDFFLDRAEFSDQLRLYAREAVADISTCYFLTLVGVYKPARLSLRSGIENALRVKIAGSGHDIATINNVPDLVHAAKACAQTDAQSARLGSLYGMYGELCQTVHSAAIDYMALRVPFERISQFDAAEAQKNLEILGDVLRYINEIFYVDFQKYLYLIEYRNADLIRDAIEAKVKGEALTAGQ
jgi:hypothetical protein